MNEHTIAQPAADAAYGTPQAPAYDGPIYGSPVGASSGAAPPPRQSPSNKGALVVLGISVLALLALLTGGILVARSRTVDLTSASSAGGAAAAAKSTLTSLPGTVPGEVPTTVTDLVPEATTDAAPTTVAAAPTTAAPAPAPVPAPKSSPAPAPKPSGNSGGQTGGGAPAGPAPSILSFTTPENIDCHNGNFQTFSASWKTANATKTTISIDGAGVYQTYGPSAEASLPFNCNSAHTFVLTAHGQNGKTVTRSITLQPRNVQPPEAPDAED